MRSYNKLLVVFPVVIALVLAGVNLLFGLGFGGESGKPYLVDINRASDVIERAGDPYAARADDYLNLEAIGYLPETADEEEIAQFFSDSANVVFRPYDGGLLRFDYIDSAERELALVWTVTNLAIGVIAALCLIILLYVRSKLIKPFTRISDLLYELSKGHLTSGLKESKSRYFGRFIWGLDLLRETLEARKQNELALTRENKMMVLALSHDIKTPLSAIRLYGKALAEDLYDTEEKRREVILGIDEKAEEMEGLVRDIIKTSREDFLHIEVREGEFYLGELIDRIRAYYGEKLALVKCEFIVDTYRNLLLSGDIERYVEVMENIIENAIKYGDGREIRIDFPVEEDHQLIAVTNTGNSLPGGELVHIWESFWRGSNVERQSGSGLGLYICRRLMNAMQGDIYAEIRGDDMVVTLIPKEA
ncbi:MAG TPA: sensor histidine kinase [Coriobacteriia bacterium]|nr:sensor histidine kinase [Coriobacteriia bacterium]